MYDEMIQMIQDNPEMLNLLMIVYIIVGAIALAISVALYILQGIGVCRMAKTAGIARAGFAYVPFARWYVFGKLAEAGVRPGTKSAPFSVHLLVLSVLQALLNGGYTVFYLFYMLEKFGTPILPLSLLPYLNVIGGLSIALQVINLIYSVFVVYCLFRVFKLFGMASPIAMAILCGIFNILRPILLFVCRNRTMVAPPPPPTDDENDSNGFYYDR